MANVGSLRKGRSSAKNVAFFVFFCLVHFQKHICCLMNFDYNRHYLLVVVVLALAVAN